MKLSKAQLATLEAVEMGEVRMVYYCYYPQACPITNQKEAK